MSLSIPTVIIKDDVGNTTQMTPTALVNGAQSTPFTFLSNLGYALSALTQPTNPTTCNFQNAIGVQDTATMPVNSIVKVGGAPASLYGIEYNDSGLNDFNIKTASGNGASLKITNSVFNPTNYLRINNLEITNIDALVGTMTYIPSFVLPAVSNQSIQIPPFTQTPHQIILQSDIVPLIDTLEPTGWNIQSGEQVNCFGANTNTNDMYLGCESGNIYWFNNPNLTWDLIMTMNGSVRCLYFHIQSGRMYIGFKGDSMNSPFTINGLNHICYSSQFPDLYNGIAVDIWFNYGSNGFNRAVNAITGDGNYLYFGGEFEYDYNGSLTCRHIAMYDWNASGYLYAFDNNSGNGFDDTVNGLSIISDKLCATGMFQTVLCNMGSITARYCVCLTMITGYIVNSLEYLFGDPTALSTPIDIYDSVKGDGTIFWISTNDNIIAGNSVFYMIQAPYSAFSTNSVVGNNQYISPQTSYNLQGTIGSVSYSNQEYYIFGLLKATFTFQPYIYWNYMYGRQEFIDLSSGAIYAFTGPQNNTFNLMGGRIINYAGNTYSTGWSITPTGNGFGYSSTLLWNGSYYYPTALSGGNPV